MLYVIFIMVLMSLFSQTLYTQLILLPAAVSLYTAAAYRDRADIPWRAALLLGGMTMFFHLFLRFESGWFHAFSEMQLWEKTLFFTARNLLLFLLMYLFVHILKRRNVYSKLRRLDRFVRTRGLPGSRVLQAFFIALIYRDLVEDEIRSLQQLHRILGLEKPVQLAAKIRWYGNLILPLIAAGMERSEQVGIALSSRGFNSGK